MIKTKKQKKKHKSTEIKSLKRDFCNGCVMLKNKPEKACKENSFFLIERKNFNKTQGFEENAIFTCFEFKLDKKNTLWQPSLSVGIFYITLSEDLRTQTSHPANWHLHIPETYKIWLAEESLVCSWLHLRQKKKNKNLFCFYSCHQFDSSFISLQWWQLCWQRNAWNSNEHRSIFNH